RFDRGNLRTMAIAGVRGRLRAVKERLFAPRDLIMRTEGRVKYVTLTPRLQMISASVLLVALSWFAFSSVQTMLAEYRLSRLDGADPEREPDDAAAAPEADRAGSREDHRGAPAHRRPAAQRGIAGGRRQRGQRGGRGHDRRAAQPARGCAEGGDQLQHGAARADDADRRPQPAAHHRARQQIAARAADRTARRAAR